MTNEVKINQLLGMIKTFIKKYPDYDLLTNRGFHAIYHQLYSLGVKPEDKSFDLTNNNSSKNKDKSVFDSYKQSFVGDQHTHVSTDSTNNYFCEFYSTKIFTKDLDNHIKIYIPLDAKHIEDGAIMIFKFLSEHNIPHESKVSKIIRFDDIVVRLVDPKDAETLINFVKNNNYLQEGLIDPNPFAFQKDNLALALDGCQSYNSIVTQLIINYVTKCKKENKLDSTSCNDFFKYIVEQYRKEFINYEEKNDLENIYWDLDDPDNNYDRILEDLEQITLLIMASYSQNFSFDDYIRKYESHSNYCNSDTIDNYIKQVFDSDSSQEMLSFMKRFAEESTEKRIAIRSKNIDIRKILKNPSFRVMLAKKLQDENITLEEYLEKLGIKITNNQK